MRDEADDPDSIDLVLSDELERAERAGRGQQAEAFGRMVFRGAVPLAKALDMYLEEREEGNPYGYDPLAITTAMNIRSSMKHLIAFLDGPNPTLHDVTPDKVFKFRNEYLPLVAMVSAKTVAKHTTLLRGLWAWAISDKRLLKTRGGKPIANPWIVKEQGTSKRKATKKKPDEKRDAFTAQQVTKLFEGFPVWGNRQGDLLRLALATGCRVDEIGALKLQHIASDASGFDIVKGKTVHATRFIPVVEEAQCLLGQRNEMVRAMQEEAPENELRLFPEWPLKPSTQKVNSASQWFTRYRRQALGAQTDGKLAMHSFRHTWRTMARRAGVAEDRIHELGGWSDEQKNTSRDYDHGLGIDLLREEQMKVWKALKDAGYLAAF